jgi:hypothetical protein
MNGQTIANLLIAIGPAALRLIPELTKIWSKDLTYEEVLSYCNLAEKSYDQYIAEGKVAEEIK